jgi:hypothetical protein
LLVIKREQYLGGCHYMREFVPLIIVIIVSIIQIIWTFFCHVVKHMKHIKQEIITDDIAILIATSAVTFSLCSTGLTSVAWACLIPITVVSVGTLCYHTYHELQENASSQDDDDDGNNNKEEEELQQDYIPA